MDISKYPITTPFGWVSGYPLNQTDPVNHPGAGFHNGIDYGVPMNTPVIVNGVQIALSNNTGASTGPHLHVGKYSGGAAQNPGVGNGFKFNSAVVFDVGKDATNGNYVRITADGALWNYLHLADNSIKVKAGQVLQGGDVAEKINLNTSRILSHGVLARNGLAGRPYSLDGSAGDPWLGGELTNEFVQAIFDSTEARQWRDSNDANSIRGINARLNAPQPPAAGGFTDQDRATAQETNTLIKTIKDKIFSLFK